MSLTRLVGKIAGVAFARGLGLVLALAVSVLLANRLGAGATTDAFFFARRLTVGVTEALRRVAGLVLVPGLVSALRSLSARDVARLWLQQLTRIVSISILAAIAGALFAPQIVRVLGPGLEAERAALAVRLIRILVFLIPAGLFVATSSGLLNAGRRYGVPAMLSMVPRLLVVISLLLFVPPMGVELLAWVLLIGSITAGLALYLIIRKVLPRLQAECASDTPSPPGETTGRLWPSLLLQGYAIAIVWIDLAFASTLGSGGLSVLEYGNRLMTILPGLLSTSLMTVMYTEYSHGAAEGNTGAMQRSLVQSARGGLFILVPLTGFFALWGDGIVRILLHHGAFGADTADLTTWVMRMIAPAVIFSFLSNILTSGLFADPKAPRMKMLGISMAVALVCRVVSIKMLIGPFGVSGIALGNSLASLCMLCVLYPMLKRLWGGFVTPSDFRGIAGIAAATGITLAIVHGVRLLSGFPQRSSLMTEALVMLGTAVVGGGAYLALAWILRFKELSVIKGLLRRRRS